MLTLKLLCVVSSVKGDQAGDATVPCELHRLRIRPVTLLRGGAMFSVGAPYIEGLLCRKYLARCEVGCCAGSHFRPLIKHCHDTALGATKRLLSAIIERNREGPRRMNLPSTNRTDGSIHLSLLKKKHGGADYSENDQNQRRYDCLCLHALPPVQQVRFLDMPYALSNRYSHSAAP